MGSTPASMLRRKLLKSAIGLAMLPALAGAELRFPVRPVKVIVPFPPGQAADTLVRILANRLTEMWGQQVIIDNRAGGLGIPAMLAGRAATPDGHTLILGTTSSLCVNPALRGNLPYDVWKDFTPVSNIAIAPLAIITHPSFPPKSVSELVALAKKSPKPLQFASAGVGTSQHMTGELFAARAGIKLEHVPYKGSAPAISDVMGGQVMLMADSVVSALPHIKAGKVRALAVTTVERIPQLPDVPTVAESGYPGFEGTGWASMMAPAATPRELVDKISGDIQLALKYPKVAADFLARGGIPAPTTPAQLGQFLRAETEKWTTLARNAHIKLDD